MAQESVTVVVNRSPTDVFDAVADITRMGEWSPECVAGRWVAPATGPEIGAKFEGDNIAKLGPVTLKRWTTTSEVTECTAGEVFEFVAEGYTKWRYELTDEGGTTQLTESFNHTDATGWQKFLYNTIARRPAAMIKGLERTLGRIKETLESESGDQPPN